MHVNTKLKFAKSYLSHWINSISQNCGNSSDSVLVLWQVVSFQPRSLHFEKADSRGSYWPPWSHISLTSTITSSIQYLFRYRVWYPAYTHVCACLWSLVSNTVLQQWVCSVCGCGWESVCIVNNASHTEHTTFVASGAIWKACCDLLLSFSVWCEIFSQKELIYAKAKATSNKEFCPLTM